MSAVIASDRRTVQFLEDLRDARDLLDPGSRAYKENVRVALETVRLLNPRRIGEKGHPSSRHYQRALATAVGVEGGSRKELAQ